MACCHVRSALEGLRDPEMERLSQCGSVRDSNGDIYRDEEWFWHHVHFTGLAGDEYASEDCDREVVRLTLDD